jgi:hypothetical protein
MTFRSVSPWKRGANHAVPVNKEGEREPQHISVTCAEGFIAHGHGVVQLEALDEATRRGGGVIHGDADYLEPLQAILPLPYREDWHLHLARRAPGSPEVEQHHLAAVASEANRLAVEVLEREVRRLFVEDILRRKGRVGG